MSKSGPDDAVKVLEARDHVRTRPAMYIGNTDARGLLDFAVELIELGVTLASDGGGTRVAVTIHEDHSLSVENDGSGLSGEGPAHPDLAGVSPLQAAFTMLRARNQYDVTPRFGNGVSPAVAAFLSEWMDVESRHEGHTWKMRLYDGGLLETGPIDNGHSESDGLFVHAMQDPKIFANAKLDFESLVDRCRAMAIFEPKLTMVIEDRRSGISETLAYPQGPAQRLEEIALPGFQTEGGSFAASSELRCDDRLARLSIAMCFQSPHWRKRPRRELYANGMLMSEGGSPLAGAIDGLSEAAAYSRPYRTEDLAEKLREASLLGARVAESVAIVICLEMSHPQFEGPGKDRVIGQDFRSWVRGIVFMAVSRRDRHDADIFWKALPNC